MLRIALLTLILPLASTAAAAEFVPLGEVEFHGAVEGPLDLSAVQVVGDALAIASDETAVLQILKSEGDDHYRVHRTFDLLPDDSTEIDLEALALDGGTIYALGSHSRARSSVRDDTSRKKNRRRLTTIKVEASRDHLFRVRLDPVDGRPTSNIKSRSLRGLLANHPLLRLFAQIPGKENGIDFEGLAIKDSRLYLGLRGPVLRGSYVPIVSFAFKNIDACTAAGTDWSADAAEECQLHYVNLDGRGIRSLHQVSDGFLIVAGPMGDGGASYQLYFWDGRDCVPSNGSRHCRLELLGDVPAPVGAKAEGLAVLAESATVWDILVVYDGVRAGARFRVER